MSTEAANLLGITGGLQGIHPIGCSCWSVFWNLRGSVLWGDSNNFVKTGVTAVGPGGDAAQYNGVLAVNDESLFIAEAQLGVQWEYELACAPSTAFLRIAAEYQWWETEGGINAFSTSGAFFLPDAGVIARSETSNSHFDLIGLSVGAGIMW